MSNINKIIINKDNIRIKQTIQKMVANGGKSGSLAQAMRDAGYSESYARNPQKIKQTKAWKAVMQELLPDEELILKLRTITDSRQIKKMKFHPSFTDKDIITMLQNVDRVSMAICRTKKYVEVTFHEHNARIQIKGLDMVYRLKGRYKHTTQCDSCADFQSKYGNLSHKELMERREQLMARFKKKNISA